MSVPVWKWIAGIWNGRDWVEVDELVEFSLVVLASAVPCEPFAAAAAFCSSARSLFAMTSGGSATDFHFPHSLCDGQELVVVNTE